MRFFTAAPTQKQIDAGLLVLRVATGIIMMAHGYQKVFTYGLEGVTQGFSGMGIPVAGLMAPFISFLELVGGAALIAGAFTRVFALLLMFDMLGAMFLVHWKEGFFLPKGYEFTLILAAASAAVGLIGAGRYSIDAILGGRRGNRL